MRVNASRAVPASKEMRMSQLAALSIKPVFQSIERAVLHMRLRNSVMAVDVLERQLKNDRAALVMARVFEGQVAAQELESQIEAASAEVADEHLLQAQLNSRLHSLRRLSTAAHS